MKQYNKPEIKELIIEIEDVIAASSVIDKIFNGDKTQNDQIISDWF